MSVLGDQRARAQATLPRDVFDYYDGGGGDETALAEAEASWAQWRLRPHVLRDVSVVDLGVTLLGTSLPHPVLVAPTAWHEGLHRDAELATAAGTAAAGALFVLSTRCSRPVEDVARGAGPWWMQVYVTPSTDALVERAVAAGASALVLTGDTPYVGRKRRAGRPFAVVAEQDPSVTVDAIARLAERSGLPVLVKGVLRGDDAKACLDAGAAGLIVSNHGGRQLGRAVSTVSALPEVVAAADGAPVLVDGGLRTGEDILVALALGASAVLLGRPVLWGLAADGADGVRAALDAVVDDLRFSLALMGVTRPSALRPADVTPAGR